jgi:riboflavin kinase/FMN adenylyltransferase
LRHMGAELGFAVRGLELVGADAPLSSTQIRLLLRDGLVEAAATMLGRDHQVRGVVQRGDARGRELGFPTANVAVPSDICLPADGIYAGWYRRPNGDVHQAALSLGTRPTFYDHDTTSLLEAYLLDFDGDLYDQPAEVSFHSRLRPEERFESIEALVAQIDRDVTATREALSGSA